MKAKHLGHVVFYVRDMEKALNFYERLIGFKRVGSMGPRMVALSSGRTHHEILLIEAGDAPGPLKGHRLGLYHVGIKVGDSLDDLREAKRELLDAGVTITGMSDHTVSQSLYVEDPDGNEVELYVDADPEIWKENPEAVMSPIKPLDL